jgi:nitrogen fixation/metabolism regulation signal transduction histidine kinase
VLNIDLSQFENKQISQIGQTHAFLKDFCVKLDNKIKGTEQDWQLELEVFTPQGTKTILCKSVSLPSEVESQRGCVLVIDDVTTLLQAQRDSAWGEVARRLAHEIKNPLTPIQLSAERLRRKILPTLQDEQSELLDRATNTIVQQVESMKLMVNDFSEYARMPTMEPHPLDLNILVSDIVELYKGDKEHVQIELECHPHVLMIRGDSTRLGQVIHNLVRNAIEAMPGNELSIMRIHTYMRKLSNTEYAGIKITDNGPGVPQKLIARIFDPYMTTKIKGNGLGLAIVKKIIEEHNGQIQIENDEVTGAIVNIRFPLYSQTVKSRDNIEGVSE